MKIRTELHKNLSEWIFRLEFHEERQSWHYERHNSKRPENTFGWKTILQSASQLVIDGKANLDNAIELALKKDNEMINKCINDLKYEKRLYQY